MTRGEVRYRRTNIALFLAGFATFSLLYCVQPLLPVFSQAFHVAPASSALSLSLATGALAISILCAAALSERAGRRELMFASMCASAVLNMAAALAPNWSTMLALRTLEGFVLGGVPAVAMTYLSEEVNPKQLGHAMGLYVSGTALGGMLGRVGTGILTEYMSWRPALAVMGACGLAASIAFVTLLPPSRNFTRRVGLGARHHFAAWGTHLRNPALPFIYMIGFTVMGAFVTVFNYAGYRLIEPPYNLNQTALGLIFSVYVFGVMSSSIAGGLADRIGRRAVLPVGIGSLIVGVGLTLFAPLWLVFLGITFVTMGFFTAHAVASGWVGQFARVDRGHATSLYLLSYYMGSSLCGSVGGWCWSAGGWPGVAAFVLGLLAIGLVCAARLARLGR
ncbi:MFS transporter [Ameyamaea chiangmaiensis]|nr:MFS transporter [Ameyamaea chiangmaiensis]